MKKLFFFLFFMTVTLLSNAQYELPKLNYSYAALEPYIDSQTMRIHYTMHHQAYVNNLNKAVENSPLKKLPIDELIKNIKTLPADLQTAVRNNGGGHYNHTFFWSIMQPVSSNNIPSGEIVKAIEKSFGSIDEFKAAFEKAGTGRFGSGWAWLIVDDNRELKITSTPNQDNPIMDIAEVHGLPVLGVDVWEHAYYLKYQSKRADYLKAFWNVVNWGEVNRLYKKATAK